MYVMPSYHTILPPSMQHSYFDSSGHIIHFTELAPRPSVILASTMPVLQFRGRTLFMHRKTEQECRRACADASRCWFQPHVHTAKSTTFMLHTEIGHKRGRHAIVAWHFPIERLQLLARRFLTRRREQRRLALAMALHPRLGAASPVRAWLNEDVLCKICAAPPRKTPS